MRRRRRRSARRRRERPLAARLSCVVPGVRGVYDARRARRVSRDVGARLARAARSRRRGGGRPRCRRLGGCAGCPGRPGERGAAGRRRAFVSPLLASPARALVVAAGVVGCGVVAARARQCGYTCSSGPRCRRKRHDDGKKPLRTTAVLPSTEGEPWKAVDLSAIRAQKTSEEIVLPEKREPEPNRDFYEHFLPVARRVLRKQRCGTRSKHPQRKSPFIRPCARSTAAIA